MRAPPPDFRYVGLSMQHRGRGGRAVLPATTGVLAAGAALHGGLLEAACVGAATLATLDVARRVLRARGDHASFAIVPWGILLSGRASLRVLPWAAVTSVRVEVRHGRDAGQAIATDSTVIINTPREVLRGTAPGAVGLESLVVHVTRWAEEASCPIAEDLEGQRLLGVGAAEPDFSALVERAAQLAGDLRGAANDALPFGYRGATDADAWRESSQRLRSVLRSRQPSRADARPLAALLAARVGAVACVPALLRLVSAPSAFLSLAAKAAVLRLGGALELAGGLEEVAPFVAPEDLLAAADFVDGGR